MPAELLNMFLKKENSLYYHYKLVKWLDSCSLEEYRYFIKLSFLLK
jgi:hypothetical protein